MINYSAKIDFHFSLNRSDKFHDNENTIFVEISPLISYAGEVRIRFLER